MGHTWWWAGSYLVTPPVEGWAGGVDRSLLRHRRWRVSRILGHTLRRVSGWLDMRVSTMRYSAALAWRSPPRLSR